MKLNLRKEITLIVIVLLPFLYLFFIWDALPEQVPLHWDFKGEIDRYGSKWKLLFIPILLPLLIYLIFLIVPFIDPKGQIEKMGSKYGQLKFIFTVLMSALAIYIIYSVKQKELLGTNMFFIAIGAMYSVLGNFFQAIRHNYFIGIRTPWTLENKTIWDRTHRFAGKLWLPGGLAVILCSLLLEKEANWAAFIIITLVITIIPVAYSYREFKRIQKEA